MQMNEILNAVPEMLSTEDIKTRLLKLPEKKAANSIQEKIIELYKIYDIYVPTYMSAEIYNKMYMALVRSLSKKKTLEAVSQRHENHKAICSQSSQGIIGGADSFTIIGNSGIGKSTTIAKVISLITEKSTIEVECPYTVIVPFLNVQCPFDSSVKGLLYEILRKVDLALETNYYDKAIKAKATIDMLIGTVSTVCLNHIGVLIVDEIQHVINNKGGTQLVASLTQLINNSGISIAMVGTPSCIPFFEREMQLARRSIGLCYGNMPFGDDFINTCEILLSYQYIANKLEPSEEVFEWLYEHSGGNVSILVTLMHDAQEIALLKGSDTLNTKCFKEAYDSRLSMIHDFIGTDQVKLNAEKHVKQKYCKSDVINIDCSIKQALSSAKQNGLDAVEALRNICVVDEVS